MSLRIALGALIIQEKLGSSDEERVLNITENPYLQYFLDLTVKSNKPVVITGSMRPATSIYYEFV